MMSHLPQRGGLTSKGLLPQRDTLGKNGYVTLNKDECDSLDDVIFFCEDQLTNIQQQEEYKKLSYQ